MHVSLLNRCIILSQLIASFENSVYVLEQVTVLVYDLELSEILLLFLHSLLEFLNLFWREISIFLFDLSTLNLLKELLLTNEVVQQRQLGVDLLYFHFCLLHFRCV